MNSLITQCKKKGNGLPKTHLTELRSSFYRLSIEENELKDGYSYFPVGMKRNARIGKIAFDNTGRIYLEFNYVNFDDALPELVEKLWKLDDSDRQRLHAGGVSYCYVGEDIKHAKSLIELAIKTHSILNGDKL
ncbi:hypothetical protein ACT8ZR_02085 [Neobacillus sp. M.A.Huq-85]